MAVGLACIGQHEITAAEPVKANSIKSFAAPLCSHPTPAFITASKTLSQLTVPTSTGIPHVLVEYQLGIGLVRAKNVWAGTHGIPS